MLYHFLQFLMRKSIAAHYLEVKGIGINNIPKNGPIMIAASHPNSFLDAIIIAVLIDRPLHFLARSDVFTTKWANYILRKLNLIPIYRLQEGHENLNRNDVTFKECYEILNRDGAILIFVEGISLTDMKLRPLKKGLARIAFSFVSNPDFNKDCSVIPIALNYDRPMEFRSKITAAVGEVISVSDYIKIYETNNNKGFIELNKIIFKELQDHTIEVEEENYMIYKAMAELDSCFEQNSLSRKKLIADTIAKESTSSKSQYLQLRNTIKESFSLLKKYGLNFRKLKINHGVSNLDVLILIALSPVALIGFLINFIPLTLAKIISDKYVKLDEFYASVRLVSGTILWLIFSIIITVILTFNVLFLFVIIPFAMYSSVKVYLYYYERLKYIRASIRLGKLKKNKKEYKKLQQLIKKIYRLRTEIGVTIKPDEENT